MARWGKLNTMRISLEDEIKDSEMSELEKLVALDMLREGYDYVDLADVNEYWHERLASVG